jgi:hypothetical protein
MWDTAEHARRGACLSHDRPCPTCGHAAHTFLACSSTCACEPPPAPGAPVATAPAETLGLSA